MKSFQHFKRFDDTNIQENKIEQFSDKNIIKETKKVILSTKSSKMDINHIQSSVDDTSSTLDESLTFSSGLHPIEDTEDCANKQKSSRSYSYSDTSCEIGNPDGKENKIAMTSG